MLARAISLFGAVAVLVAYGANQLGRLDQRRYPYLLLNLLGGAILTIFAVRAKDPGLTLMEGSWVVISLAGILFVARRKRTEKDRAARTED
jgi:hypothetical protein